MEDKTKLYAVIHGVDPGRYFGFGVWVPLSDTGPWSGWCGGGEDGMSDGPPVTSRSTLYCRP